MVALPGWYADFRRAAYRADVVVLNPKMHNAFLEKRDSTLLSE